MLSSATEMIALQRAADLETPLSAVEAKLASLGAALRDNDSAAIETEAADLHRALSAAVAHFGRATREGGVPLPLRRRLAVAGGQVAAQREALARATAALDRAIDVLLPGMGSNVYAPSGTADRNGSSPGSLVA